MGVSATLSAPPRLAWIHSTRVHVELYSFLLVVTPLVMLRSFLQQFIAKLSDYEFSIFGFHLPVILTIVTVLAVALFLWNWRRVTRWHLLAIGIVIAMDFVAQQVADYYMDHRFYDLQQNWHYVAYGLFSWMMYRDLAPRGWPLARIILLTVSLALLFSTFDEAFQKFVNTRVFDICDIAKDAYGSMAGLVIVSLGGSRRGELLANRRLRHPRLKDYFTHPLTALISGITFTLLLLVFGSLLSDADYLATAVLLAVAAFVFIWMVVHLSQFRIPRYLMIGLLAAGILTQAFFFLRHRHDGIVYNRFGLTVYKGIPIPYFDVLIFPDGHFRLVDKKHIFNAADRRFLYKQDADILLIGSGSQGRGGNGFPARAVSQFTFNPFTQRATHVIIMKTDDACKTFNRLRKDRKNVLFVLHNTC